MDTHMVHGANFVTACYHVSLTYGDLFFQAAIAKSG